MKTRLLTVSPETEADELRVRVAPGYVTTLTFDMPLAPEGVRLEAARGRFKRLDVTEHRVTLEPATELGHAEQVRLTVAFADEIAPTGAVITLVPGTATVDTRVRVSRRPATMGELLVELEEARAQREAAGQQAQDAAARCLPRNLRELVFSGLLGDGEFSARPILVRPDKNNGTEGLRVTRYRTAERFLLAFRFRNIDSAAEPWTPDQVQLIHLATQTSVKALSVEMRPARFIPDEAAFVLVELEAVTFRPDDDFFLAFSNKAGTQVLRWKRVSL